MPELYLAKFAQFGFFCDMNRLSMLIVALSMFVLTGCDFFRTLAGRPTSKDIERMQVESLLAEKSDLLAANKLLEKKCDSLQRAFTTVTDSLNALDSISQYGGTVLNPTTLGGLFSTRLEARYYVIIGAFRYRTNAEILLNKAVQKGYKPALISFRNGKMAVGVCPTNNIKDAFIALKKVKKESFCPADVWVLLNE